MAKIAMTTAQAAVELHALAAFLRRGEINRQDTAAALTRLAERFEGFDPLPRMRLEQLVVKGRRIQVQAPRSAFGL
jgi:hypothetical protein